MKKLHFLAAIVIATFATTQVSAQAGTSAPTTVCLPASQDAIVHEWVPTTNYGSAPVLFASRWTYTSGGGSGFYTIKTFTQFDLSALPTGAIITSATMKLHVDTTDPVYNSHRDLGGGSGNGATIEQVGSAWNESTVTWATKPTSFLSSTTIPSLGNLSTADVVVNVTAMVQNMVLTGVNNGFQTSMTDNSDYYHSLVFGSRENTNSNGIFRPELCITYSTPCIDWSLCGNTITATDFIGSLNNENLNFRTNNLQRMTLGKDGKLGLGVNPTANAAFHIRTGANPGQLPSNFIFERNDGTNQAGVFSLGISGSVWPTYAATVGAGSACFKLDDPFGNSQNSDMVFSTNAIAPQFIIKHSGNIGIGTTTPLHKLHVNDGALMLSGTVAGFGGPQLLFSDNVATHPNGRWALEYITATSTRPSMGGLNFWTPFNPGGGSGTAGNYSLFLKDDGKIAMGATDDNTDSKFCASALPNGYRLYVNGGILTTKVKVANYCSSAWADFVFANDYKLKPLSEIETFIKENKHLPNVPSATEIEKDGLDIADMQSKQMEKIEELTLYMIAMEKKIQALENQNEVLSAQISKK